MWHAEFKLILYPIDSKYTFNQQKITKFLKKIALIDEEINNNRLATGEQFLSLFTFMGCSPDIELEPQKDKPFCYIEIETRSKPEFIFGKNLKKSRCYNCKKDIIDPVICPHCQYQHQSEKINWRKTAFLASCWITIGNIYELEAIPNDQLLDLLEKETDTQWKPAYIRFNRSED